MDDSMSRLLERLTGFALIPGKLSVNMKILEDVYKCGSCLVGPMTWL